MDYSLGAFIVYVLPSVDIASWYGAYQPIIEINSVISAVINMITAIRISLDVQSSVD